MSGYLPAPPPVSPFRTSFALNTSGTTPRSAPPAINEAHHPTQWDRSEIRDWLESIKCGQYSRLFEDNHITGDLLLECDQDVLKDMGIKKVGDRIRINQALKALRARSRLSRSGSRRRREKSLQQLDKDSVSPFVNGTSSSPIDGYFSSKNRRANPRQPTSAPTSTTKIQEATKREDGDNVVLSKQNTVKFIYLQGQSKTVNISGCYTARQIKLRALKKINIEDESTVDSWTVYVADNELGTTTRPLSDDELTNICRSQRFSEKRRLIICPDEMLPSLKQLSKSQQILRSSLNSTDSTMPKLEDDEDEDLTDEEDQATVFPDQYRGPGENRLSDRRPPSELISSNLAHFFPEAATQELEKTVRNSIRFSKRMSRFSRLSTSRASIVSSLALGIPEDTEDIPPVPQMPDINDAPPIPSNPPPPPPVPKPEPEPKEEEVESETVKDERLLRRSILTRRFREDDSKESKRHSIMPISKRASVAFSVMDIGDSSSDEGDNDTATLKLETVNDAVPVEVDEENVVENVVENVPVENQENKDDEEDEDEEEEDEGEEEEEDDDEEDVYYSDHEEDAAPSRWIKGRLIGSGSFGTVYLGMNSFTGELMAVKQVELPSDEASAARKKVMVDALQREMDILRELQHENIVQYLGSNSEDDYLNIFLEYVPGGSVASLLASYGEFNEELIRNFVRQILQGLSYLHGQNIIHRDIKGANVLVDNKGGIKISDFGISKKIETKLLTSRASMQGSVYWMAPEVVKKSHVTIKADIWSLGCLIIEMFSGQHPFPEFSQIQALFKLGQSQGPTIPPICSDEAREFLQQTLAADYNERPSADELLKHEFLKKMPV